MSDQPGLTRRLGTVDAVVIGLGSMIGAGVFSVFAPAAAAAGSGFLIGLGIAAVVAYCNATASAQLAMQYPTSGGTYVYGRELRGGGGVTERDRAGERQPDQQAAARCLGRRRERREDPGSDHRAEADHDRLAGAEAAGESGRSAHIASATRRAAAASSSSDTFGSTSSQRGSIIPLASSIPSGMMLPLWEDVLPNVSDEELAAAAQRVADAM